MQSKTIDIRSIRMKSLRNTITLTAVALALIAWAVPGFAADQSAGGDNVVLKVDGKAISEKDIKEDIDQFCLANAGRIPPAQMQNKYATFFSGAKRRLTRAELLDAQCAKLNIPTPTDQVDELINEVKGQVGSDEQYQALLKQQNITEKELRETYAKQLRFQNLLKQEVKDPAEPSEEELKKFYDTQQQFFKQPEQVKASHILLMVDENASGADRQKAKDELAAIRKDIASGKTSFADAAKEHSQCPSAPQGGDLGYFGRGQMVKPFEDVAFTLKPGEMSDIVETQFGYHIIKVTDKKEAGVRSFDEVKDRISEFLKQQEQQKLVEEYIDGLEKDAKIETVMSDDAWQKKYGGSAPAAGSQQIQIDPDSLK
ncbi:MAG: peptidylprolyl isomerase [bacterium]|nr:peptidylprolyl isomerase [bacterium]